VEVLVSMPPSPNKSLEAARDGAVSSAVASKALWFLVAEFWRSAKQMNRRRH
jgi:hypothetical protein